MAPERYGGHAPALPIVPNRVECESTSGHIPERRVPSATLKRCETSYEGARPPSLEATHTRCCDVPGSEERESMPGH